MKKMNFILLAMVCFTTMACNSSEPKVDNIASNLLKKGSADPTLLVGMWDVIKFAHTTNGNKISNKDDLSFYNFLGESFYSSFEVSNNVDEDGYPLWFFHSLATFRVEHSISVPNLIELSLFQITFNLVDSPQMDAIVAALNNAYSFVVIEDEMIIHFTDSEEKNLLILKRNER